MWFAGLRNVWSRNLLKWTIQKNMDHNALNLWVIGTGRMIKRSLANPYYSTLEAINGENEKIIGKMTLAKNLACLVEESSNSNVEESKPKTRMEVKRLCELRIKKRVKEQYVNAKFRNIMGEVIANPKTLKDAYDSIRANSNIYDDNSLEVESIPFESIAKELSCGIFDINANVFSISTRGAKKEVLVLPNLKLKIVQEAIRIALDVIYRPLFFKTSHGCRSGRGHFSALKYVCKEISDPDWWVPLIVSKKLDSLVLTKFISTMETRIEDANLYNFLKKMFDADVLNLEFGGFHKGHGLPQEGVLSPILMNIYLDLLDREVYRLSMKYEINGGSLSNLRSWFRRQMNGNSVKKNDTVVDKSGIRVHNCRFMDEIFIAVTGSKDVAIALKSEIQSYLMNSLHLNVDDQTEIFPCNGRNGVRFLGFLLKRSVKDGPAVRAVHKLKEKVQLFASQKRESWDDGIVRIGKKWLSHGLKKVKESEIKHLANNSSVLSKISRFRKSGMETDQWYKVLIKIWMQEIKNNAKSLDNEENLLSKHIAEPALPKELRDSYFKFQKCAEEYVNSETSAILELMPNSSTKSESYLSVTEIIAPVNVIKKRLTRYGLTNAKGIPHTCHMLILQDADQIIDWFSGIACRWIRWYSECNNLSEVNRIIGYELKKSCIRTLAAKYRIHESEIEKRFDSELSRIQTENETIEYCHDYNAEEALMYGICYSGLCLLSLARIVSSSRPCTCFVMGCVAAAPCVYTLHVRERQKYPSWKTGFSTCIHPSLHGRRIGLCKHHLKDLYIGRISLQSIDFGAWK